MSYQIQMRQSTSTCTLLCGRQRNERVECKFGRTSMCCEVCVCVLMSNVSKCCAVVEYETRLVTRNQLHVVSVPLLPKEGNCSFFQCVSLKTHTNKASENILPATFSVSCMKSTHTIHDVPMYVCVRTNHIFHGDLFIYFYLLILMQRFWSRMKNFNLSEISLNFNIENYELNSKKISPKGK